MAENYEEEEVEAVRDLTDEEFASLTQDERKSSARKVLHLKVNHFHANMMLMNAQFLPSELRDLEARDPPAAAYLRDLTNKCAKLTNQGQQLVCMLQLACKSELAAYTKCLIQYQRSPFLCKVLKNEMLDCH